MMVHKKEVQTPQHSWQLKKVDGNEIAIRQKLSGNKIRKDVNRWFKAKVLYGKLSGNKIRRYANRRSKLE